MARGDRIHIRCSVFEKEAFSEAAELLGLDLSDWIRMVLRKEAELELTARALPVPFAAKKAKRKAQLHVVDEREGSDPQKALGGRPERKPDSDETR